MVVFSIPEDASYNGRAIYMFADRLAKGYIGKSVTFKDRVSSHRRASRAKKDGDWKSKSVWNEAIRRIGWHNLTVMILEFVPEGVSLIKRERYWIARLKTKYPNGYNKNEGGGGVTRHTEEAKAKISAGNKGKKRSAETRAKMSAKKMGNTNAPTKPVTSREIKKQFADGTQLVEFVLYASAREAERKTKVSNAHISNCCLENHNSAAGRFWHFTEDGDLVGEHRVDNIRVKPRPNARAVFSKSPGGEKQRHEGSRAAERTLSKATGKKFSQSHISKCCNGNATHHHGYSFCFESEEAENKKNTKKRKLTF